MAKHIYRIASEDGVERLQTHGVHPGAAVGDEVELDLTADQKKSVVAAGWVEPHDTEASKDDAAATKGGKK